MKKITIMILLLCSVCFIVGFRTQAADSYLENHYSVNGHWRSFYFVNYYNGKEGEFYDIDLYINQSNQTVKILTGGEEASIKYKQENSDGNVILLLAGNIDNTIKLTHHDGIKMLTWSYGDAKSFFYFQLIDENI